MKFDDDYEEEARVFKDYKAEAEGIRKIIDLFIKKDEISIVDLGCGTGNHIKELASSGYRTMGIDIDETRINECKKNKPPARSALTQPIPSTNRSNLYRPGKRKSWTQPHYKLKIWHLYCSHTPR